MQKQKLPSNRNFAIVFFVVFILIGLWPIFNNEDLRYWALVISFVFLVLGIFNSKILSPLNKLWMKFGLILGLIVSPVVMGIIYFGVVTPTGILLRIFRKDVLKLKKNEEDKTYWIDKDNTNSNMKNQF